MHYARAVRDALRGRVLISENDVDLAYLKQWLTELTGYKRGRLETHYHSIEREQGIGCSFLVDHRTRSVVRIALPDFASSFLHQDVILPVQQCISEGIPEQECLSGTRREFYLPLSGRTMRSLEWRVSKTLLPRDITLSYIFHRDDNSYETRF